MELHGEKRTGKASMHPWRSRVSFRVPRRSRVSFYPLYSTDAAEDKSCAGRSSAHAP